MNVAIIGTGNVAWHLARVFEKNEILVTDIYGRDEDKAEEIGRQLYEVKINTELDFSESRADVFFVCVSDDAIAEVCSKALFPEGAIVVHTSGGRPLSDVQETLRIYHDMPVSSGVFYPVMTFTKGKAIDFLKIPIAIESENEETENLLLGLARAISNEVFLMNSKERAILHVSAVFSCNFTNHLWALSKAILDSENLEFDMLKPLIAETFKKAMASDHPADVQTGPALRGDDSSIKSHLDYLAEDEDLLEVYETLTKSIQDWHE